MSSAVVVSIRHVVEVLDELEPLRFAAGEDIQRLAEAQIAEPDLLEHLERSADLLGFTESAAKNWIASVTVSSSTSWIDFPASWIAGRAADSAALRIPGSARRGR